MNTKAIIRTEIGGEYLTNKLFETLTNKYPNIIKAHFKDFEKHTDSMKKWG